MSADVMAGRLHLRGSRVTHVVGGTHRSWCGGWWFREGPVVLPALWSLVHLGGC